MRSPLQDTLQGVEAPRKRRRVLPLLLVGGVLAGLVGISLAGSITINDSDDIEFGQGSQTASACTSAADVSLTTTVDGATGDVNTYSLTITGVDDACFGKYLRATLTGGSPTTSVQDQIVWQLVNVGGSDTAMTLSATVGGSTSSANGHASSTSTIYPLDGDSKNALKSTLASDILSVQLETSDGALSASV